MKFKLLVIILLIGGCSIYSQPLTFDRVNITDNMGRDTLIDLISEWAVMTFVTGKDVISYVNKENGVIIINGSFDYRPKYQWSDFAGNIEFSTKIYVRNDRYKIITTNFYHTSHKSKYGRSFGEITATGKYDKDKRDKARINKIHDNVRLSSSTFSNVLFVSLYNKTSKRSEFFGGKNW